jgi:hypothetical protein
MIEITAQVKMFLMAKLRGVVTIQHKKREVFNE